MQKFMFFFVFFIYFFYFFCFFMFILFLLYFSMFLARTLQDTMPRVLEVIGATSTVFVFMDQRGTTFHEDLQQLELLLAMAPVAHVTADNTLKPG